MPALSKFGPESCKSTKYWDGSRKRPCTEMCSYAIRTGDTQHLVNGECKEGCPECYHDILKAKRRKLTSQAALTPSPTTPQFLEEIPETITPSQSLTDAMDGQKAAIGAPIGFCLVLLLMGVIFGIARKRGWRFSCRRVHQRKENGVPPRYMCINGYDGFRPYENGRCFRPVGNGIVNSVNHAVNGSAAIPHTPTDKEAHANAVEDIRRPIPATDEANGIPPDVRGQPQNLPHIVPYQTPAPVVPIPPPAASVQPPTPASSAPGAAADLPQEVEDQQNPPKDCFGDGSFRG